MWYAYRFRAYPQWTGVTAYAERHIDIHRQRYNRVKYDYDTALEDDKLSEYAQNNKLPEWKRKRPVFTEFHSKSARETVARFHDTPSSVRGEKDNGGKVGRLKRRPPTEFRSVTYNQSGFDLDNEKGLIGTHTFDSTRSDGYPFATTARSQRMQPARKSPCGAGHRGNSHGLVSRSQ